MTVASSAAAVVSHVAATLRRRRFRKPRRLQIAAAAALGLAALPALMGLVRWLDLVASQLLEWLRSGFFTLKAHTRRHQRTVQSLARNYDLSFFFWFHFYDPHEP